MPYADKVRHREYHTAYRAAHREDAAARYASSRARIDAAKAVPCTDCGGRFPPECMDFDHIRGQKLRQVGQMLMCSELRIAEEIAKCEVVCANCHRTRSRKRRAG